MPPFFSDTFTEGSDTTLASHAPDVGTSWSLLWNDGAAPTLLVVAASDFLKGATVNNSGVIYTANATYPSADYDVTFTQTAGTNITTRPFYVFVRLADVDNMYAVRLVETAGGSQLYKKVAGAWTAIGSAFNGPASGSVCKLEIIGTALKFYDDGVEVASATVSDLSAAGKAGVGYGGGAELVTSTDDANSVWTIDTLTVNDLGGGGGTTFNESPSGAVTSSGTVTKRAGKPVAGAVTSAGVLANKAAKALSGAVTSAGAAFLRTNKALAGAVTSAGALMAIKTALVSVAGAVTSAGALALRTAKSLSGATTSAGVLTLSARKALSGAVTSAGTLANRTAKALAGSVTSIGTVATIKAALVALGGTLTSAGTVVKRTGKALGGTLAPDGTLARRVAKLLAGVLSSAGDLATEFSGGAQEFLVSVAGTLAPAGNVVKRMTRSLAGTLATAGTVLAQLVGPVVYYDPGTRDVRRARGRGGLLSDAPGRARAKARQSIDSEG